MTNDAAQTNVIQDISVIGAGAWGTAIASVLSAAGRSVTLYARDAGLADNINRNHENHKYLTGVALPHSLTASADIAHSVQNAQIIVLATPAQHLRNTLTLFKPHIREGVPLLNTAKGIEIASGKLLSEVVDEILPAQPFGTLSGPNFATEVARGLPTAITLATRASQGRAKLWAESLRAPAFRPYLSSDVVGVELAGALKNVIAIACGIVAGKKLGENAKAAVMTRGMAEIRRLALAKGATSETFLGLAGLGDLTLTCSSMTSRNFSLGFELGSGKKLADILAARHTVAEGVATAKATYAFAKDAGVDMPICCGIYHILYEDAGVDDIIHGLLSRHLKFENE